MDAARDRHQHRRTPLTVVGIDPTRAGCCATLRAAEYPPQDCACDKPVQWAGFFAPPYPRGRTGKIAFACQTHRDLLTATAPYGAHPFHVQEMIRRHRRDRWQH